jgi:hypothetical protein
MKLGFKALAVVTVSAALAVAGFATVIRFLPEKQKWLLVGRHYAKPYGDALLAGDWKKQERYKNDFIDYVVAVDPRTRTVLFASHDNQEIAFIYAPSHNEDELDYQAHKARKIAASWYYLK